MTPEEGQGIWDSNLTRTSHIDGGLAESEVKRATLARIGTVHGIQVCARDILGRRECGYKLRENGGGQGAEGITAVQEHRLALASTRGRVDLNHATPRLVDRDAVEVDPVSCVTVRGLGGRDDGTLDEVARVLLDVDATKNDGSCKSAWCQ